MAQADKYAEEILALDKEIAEDPYNTDLLERRQELLEAQQDCILAAEDEKQAIVDLVAEGIEIELDALQDLIDKYEDSLDSAKDLYDYNKKIKESTEEIASLEKQLSAYTSGNDTSEENRATVQSIKVQLEEARESLEETEYDNYIEQSKKLLDDLFDQYSLILNERMDSIDLLLSDMITTVNEQSGVIASEISGAAESVGYTMTSYMQSIWEESLAQYEVEKADNVANANTIITGLVSQGTLTNEQAQKLTDAIGTGSATEVDNAIALMDKLIAEGYMKQSDATSIITALRGSAGKAVSDVVTTYGTNFTNANTTTNDTLKTISTNVAAMVAASNKTATTTTSSTSKTSSTSSSSSSKSSSSSSSSSKSSSTQGNGVINVGDKVTFKSGKYYYDSFGTTPAGNKNLGKSVYVTKVVSSPKSGQDYYIHISTGSKLGSGDLGWVKKSQITGYATGGLADFTGPAWLDGSPTQPEMVLSAADTENFIALKDAMQDIANGDSPLAALFGGSSTVLEQLSEVSNPLASANGGGVNIGDISYNVNIPIDHVEDYDDLVSKMRDDGQFEKMIQAMTVDQLVGGSKLAKSRFKW